MTMLDIALTVVVGLIVAGIGLMVVVVIGAGIWAWQDDRRRKRERLLRASWCPRRCVHGEPMWLRERRDR